MSELRAGDVWRTHQRYLDEHPPQYGSEDVRTCPGRLTVVGLNGPSLPFEVECDSCGFQTGVTRNRGPEPSAAPVRPQPERTEAPKDDIPF